jgi:hypothetical protein
MIDKIGKFLDIVHAVFSIWLYKITLDKEKKATLDEQFKEADKAISERRYDDVLVIWSRMRNV